jgi:glycosyltransferase involved in cell wall biosynthesis
MPRILIVTSGNPTRNPRPLKEADALARAGFDVTLLNPRSHDRFDALDDALVRSRQFAHETVSTPPGGLARFRRWLLRRAVRYGIQSVHALGEPAALERRARQIAADLTIVHNEVPHWIGARLLASGGRVAADFEDWYSEDLRVEDRKGRPIALLRRIERQLLRHASYATTTSQALADALQRRYEGNRPAVITNAFPLQPRPRAARSEHLLSFFWFSQTIGPGRGLELFLQAWLKMSVPTRLVLLGHSQSEFERQFRAAMNAEQHSRFAVLPLVSPEELPDVIARHDIGLALEQRDIPSRDLTITNKILQYLNAGLAVVATDTTGQKEVLSGSKTAGIFARLDEPLALAAELDRLVSDRAALQERQRAARKLAEEVYCWEKEAPKLEACVRQVLG